MSLQTAAEAVRQQGRGEDTMLIHMTPDEVKGLQALAMANGGSLTVNPETGLPEAGFLKSLLPSLIGAGLMMVPGMQGVGAGFLGGTAGMIGAGVGALEFARTGDLGKGLMAGLGAYGGAGLAGGALAAGAQTNAAAEAAKQNAAQMKVLGGADIGIGSGQVLADPVTASQVFTPPETFMGNLSQAGTGVSNLFSSGAAGDAARTAATEGFTGGGAKYAGVSSPVMTGTAALASPLSQPVPLATVEPEESNYEGPYLPAERKVRFPTADRDPMDTSEFRYFDTINPYPGFVTASGAQPSLYNLAEGGSTGTPAEGPPTPTVNTPPANYRAGMQAEFDYGFRPMASQIPEIQQETAVYNPVARERYGFTPSPSGGGDGPPSTESVDMGYIPGVAANIGRTYNSLSGLEKALIPGAMATGVLADSTMRGRGYEYNPITGDYEQRDYMGGGDAGYETLSGGDDPSGGYDSYSDAGQAASDRGDTFFRAGGMTMDNGGFVIDAHTVSEIGNGSSDAGHERLAMLGGEPIEGPGDGVSDSIKANIGGVQEARIARDESYLSRDDVKALGGGDIKKGEKMLYTLMRKAHESRKDKGRGQATGLDKLIEKMAAA